MSENGNGSSMSGVFAVFAAGAALGAGLAILYAPRSGKETREMVGERVHNLRAAAGHAIDEGKHMAHEVYDKGKEAAREIGKAATMTPARV